MVCLYRFVEFRNGFLILNWIPASAYLTAKLLDFSQWMITTPF